MITPEEMCTQSAHILRLIAGQPTITKDPAELAAILRTAAQSCSDVASHNMIVQSLMPSRRN